VTNTLMVSLIVCLVQNRPLHGVWRSLQPWAFPYYLAGGALASAWVWAGLNSGAGVPVLLMITVYLLGLCYQQIVAGALAGQAFDKH
jgi:hypothetical protein